MINFVVSLSKSRSLSALAPQLQDYNADDCPLEIVWSCQGLEVGISNPGVPRDYIFHETDTHLIVLSGYIRKKGSSDLVLPKDLIDFAERPRPHVFAGMFCLCVINKATQAVCAWNTLSRQIPLYYSVLDEGGIALGTRSSLVSVIRERGRPKVNPFNLYPFYGQGFHVLETTPFNGIQVVPANSFVSCSENSVDIVPCSDVLKSFSSIAPSDELYDKLGEILANSVAVRPYLNSDAKIEIGITGGRDSRLLFAALKHAGANFSAHTIGVEGHPDVDLGKMIAEQSGIPHRIVNKNMENDSNVVRVNPLRQALTTLFHSDWMASGYDRLGNFNGKFSAAYSVNGAFGGLIRGGYPNMRALKSPKNLAVAKLDKLLDDFGILNDESKANLGGATFQFRNYFSELNSIDGLDQLHLLSRAGRWASSTFMATRANIKLTPFADNEFLQEMYRLDGTYRVTGVLLFELLKRFDERLAYMPFMGKTYPFVETPLEGYEGAALNVAAPLKVTTESTSLFNWRFALDSALGTVMKREIFRSLDGDLSQILDVEATRNIVSESISNPHNRVLGRLLWGLYSTALTLRCCSRSESYEAVCSSTDVKIPIVSTSLV